MSDIEQKSEDTMQISYWVKNCVYMFLLFLFLYGAFHLELQGVGEPSLERVTIIDVDCRGAFHGGHFCKAKVKKKNGIEVYVPAECGDFRVGEIEFMSIRTGFFSRKQRGFILCKN